MNSRRDPSPWLDWNSSELRLTKKVVFVAVGAFVIGYSASALWMRAGTSGRTVVTVPNLRDLSVQDARQAVERADLILEPADSLPHPEVAEGRVLTQSPLPGQEVAPGTAVHVILSSGRRRHEIPQVAGLSREQAVQLLAATGLQPLVEEVNDLRRAGLVVGTVPGAGSVVAVPAPVRLQVSIGPPLVAVPELIGLDERDLSVVLDSVELRIGEVRRELRLREPEGEVVGQEPAAGDSTPVGSFVDVIIATQRLEMLSPDDFR